MSGDDSSGVSTVRMSLPDGGPAGGIIALVARSVLVVDDDPEFRRLARAILDEDGLSVVGEAETVASAIAAARELRPDAALVDVSLPDGNGVDLAEVLTVLPWRPCVVLTSADPRAADDVDVRRSGARLFVLKDDLPDVALRELFGRAGDDLGEGHG